MGGAMARRLIDGGFDVICFDIDPDKIAAMAELGAKIAESPRLAADYAEIVLACLPTEEASRTVASGIAQGRVTKVYVETSTT